MESAIEPRHHVLRNDIKTQKQPEDLETYQHSPLEDSEIRLLVVEPAAEENGIVKATVRTVSFAGDAVPRYNAVSYCWGRRYSTEKILLRYASGEWKDFRVSHNLHSLLQHLRRPDRPTTLWIDAICIDQKNDREKQSQIGKMAQIYRTADEVSIWLGKDLGDELRRSWRGPETTKDTLNFISAVAEHGNQMITKDHAREWHCFISLMKRPWFSRRWVLQELAFARNPVMYCGKHAIRWEVFKSAVKVFTDHFDAVSDIIWGSRRGDFDRCQVEWANPLEVIPLAAFMGSAFEKDTHEPVFTLEALVASMAVFKTSDPRDVVYALLSVAKDSLVEPDYTGNVFQVYANFVEKVISTSGSLDIICRRWAANWQSNFEVPFLSSDDPMKRERVTLSSWMRETDGSMFNYKAYLVYGQRRRNPDPLVGMPGRSPYAACADRKAAIRMGGLRKLLRSTHLIQDESVELSHTLYAKGVIIGTVSSGDRGSEFVQSVDDSFGQDKTPATVPEKFWRTLVADRALGGGPAPEWYGNSCLRYMEMEDLKPNELFFTDNMLLDPLVFYPEDVLEFFKRVEAVVYNQRAFDGDAVNRNQEKLFGIGSLDVEAGDKICILFGCSVPVILRPSEDVDGNECFRCLGESFVYNMMNGEALEGLTDDQVKEFAIM